MEELCDFLQDLADARSDRGSDVDDANGGGRELQRQESGFVLTFGSGSSKRQLLSSKFETVSMLFSPQRPIVGLQMSAQARVGLLNRETKSRFFQLRLFAFEHF